jgi:hypothetical protein
MRSEQELNAHHGPYQEDWKDSHKVVSYCIELIPLMAEELQGFDVYKEIIESSERETIS